MSICFNFTTGKEQRQKYIWSPGNYVDIVYIIRNIHSSQNQQHGCIGGSRLVSWGFTAIVPPKKGGWFANARVYQSLPATEAKVEISQLRVKLHTETIHFAKAIYGMVNVRIWR